MKKYFNELDKISKKKNIDKMRNRFIDLSSDVYNYIGHSQIMLDYHYESLEKIIDFNSIEDVRKEIKCLRFNNYEENHNNKFKENRKKYPNTNISIKKSNINSSIKLDKLSNSKQELISFDRDIENDTINNILEIYHKISLPHTKKSNNILNLKYKGILESILEVKGKDSFNNLNIMFNPEIGLLIQSKDGINSKEQVLIMSHADLVSTFEKVHNEVYEKIRKSALLIDERGLISGSLDNTITNAILLSNFLNNSLANNVSLLFEVDEETNMKGTKGFFDKDYFYSWYKVRFDDEIELSLLNIKENSKENQEINKIKKDIKKYDNLFEEVVNSFGINKDDKLFFSLKENYKSKIAFLNNEIDKYENSLEIYNNFLDISFYPYYQDDLFVINMDVAMGFEESFIFEVKKYKNKNSLKEFNNSKVKDYDYDDSLKTVPKKLDSLSYCIVVGSEIKQKSKKYFFDGDCHNMNTSTTKFNIIEYSNNLEIVINNINLYRKEKNLELKENIHVVF